jgi:superfamily I DNA/RNA helicase
MRDSDEYKTHSDKRAAYSKEVLQSDSSKKIVMAGPGTGKSFLFQQIAKQYIGEGKEKILVLTFINELVKDLAIDMHGLADVSTLHRFAAKELSLKQQIYMDLLKVVTTDFKIETGETKDFDTILHNLEYSESQAIEYLRGRRGYYSCLDPASMVFELVSFYSQNKEKIPEYDLILVDEYQDFNLLEVELIDLLSTKSNILIAGDDDQSLYSFKHSVPENIREKHKSGVYTAFELPYCSRSTEVVIDSFHDVVNKAKSEGYIRGRIEKQYIYFPCEDKDKVSSENPKVMIRKETHQGQNAYYVDSEISKIFEREPRFDVLVICPLRNQINSLGAALRKKGYSNVSGDESPSDGSKQLANGLKYIMDDKDSNLGWRISAEALMDEHQFKEALLKSKNCDVAFLNCVPSEIKSVIKALRAACVKLKDNKPLTEEQQKLIFDKLEISTTELGEKSARNMVFSNKSNKVHQSIKVKMTTILGSKGLSYDYVFMVNFDDKYLVPKEGIDDESINKFLVAMTRSKKRIYLFTSQRQDPTFVGWINQDRKQPT